MRLRWRMRHFGRDQGQSLLETALAVPLLLAIAFNIINIAYFWFMVLSLSAAPRLGAEFATQGGSAVGTGSTPTTTAVSNLVFQNMTNAVHGASTSNTAVRVCSATSSGGVDPKTGIAACDAFGASFGFPANTADPEQPAFLLNRVDVEFTVTPLIPGPAFSVVLPTPLTFQRHVSMRSLY